MAKDYRLDANVFIQAQNGPYGFDIAPGFWDAIEEFARRQIIRSPIRVRTEVSNYRDELSKWAMRDRIKSSGLFETGDRSVQRQVGEIAQFVQSEYPPGNAKHFLDHADPWVIAHAQVNNACVVTWEVLAGSGGRTPKIPNICRQFRVECVNAYSLLRRLGIQLGRVKS